MPVELYFNCCSATHTALKTQGPWVPRPQVQCFNSPLSAGFCHFLLVFNLLVAQTLIRMTIDSRETHAITTCYLLLLSFYTSNHIMVITSLHTKLLYLLLPLLFFFYNLHLSYPVWANCCSHLWGMSCDIWSPEIFCPPGPNISGKLKYLVWGDRIFQILLEIFGPPLKYLVPH